MSHRAAELMRIGRYLLQDPNSSAKRQPSKARASARKVLSFQLLETVFHAKISRLCVNDLSKGYVSDALAAFFSLEGQVVSSMNAIARECSMCLRGRAWLNVSRIRPLTDLRDDEP